MPTNYLIVGGFQLHHEPSHKSCVYELARASSAVVFVDDDLLVTRPQSSTPDADIFLIPSDAKRLRIIVTPNDKERFHRLEGTFEQEQDVIRPKAASKADFSILLAQSAMLGSESIRVTYVAAFLSPLRDVTQEKKQKFDKDFRAKKGFVGEFVDKEMRKFLSDEFFPVDGWPLPAKDVHMAKDPPIQSRGGAPQFELSSVTPDFTVRLLEVAGANRTPKLIATAWPNALTGRDPTSFVLYIHHSIGQNAEVYQDPYPDGIGYMIFGLLTYLHYFVDPLTHDPFKKGLLYQIEASGRKAALFLPISRLIFDGTGSKAEIRDLHQKDYTADLMHEYNAWMCRLSDVFATPPIKRVAAGTFSGGDAIMAHFLDSNAGTPFYDDLLQELYVFEAATGNRMIQKVVDAGLTWQASGTASTKRLLVYSQMPSDKAFASLFSEAEIKAANPGNGRPWGLPPEPAPAAAPRTLASLTIAGWLEAVRANGGKGLPGDSFQNAHQLVAATMLLDALRRSDL